MVDGYQTRALPTPLQIPLLYGVDAVHGHNNVFGATLFPHNIGLGATRDPELVEEVGAITADEVTRHRHPVGLRAVRLRGARRALGPHVRELRRGPGAGARRWPTIVTRALRGHRRAGHRQALRRRRRHGLGTSDHRQLHASTRASRTLTEAELRRCTSRRTARRSSAGVGSVMPSYSSVGTGTGPVKMHANSDLITAC